MSEAFQALIRAVEPHTRLELEPRDLEIIPSFVQPATYEKGQLLIRPGQQCNELFFLQKGLMRSFYVFEHKEVNLRLMCEEDAVLAFTSYIQGEPSEEYIECVTDCSGWNVRLRALLETHQSIWLERVMRVLAEQHYLAMERRLRTLQLKNAEARYLYFCEHLERRIVEDMPSYHIASFLGMTPESLSRIKKNLRS